MKASTKKQKEIVEINKSLPKITHVQEEWAFKHILPHIAVRLKSGKITCLDCGHSFQSVFTSQGWQDEVMGDKCPNCNVDLKIKTTRTKNFTDDYLMHLIQVHKGYQVIRVFQIHGYYRSGKPKRVYALEQSRIYLDAKGNYEIIGHSRQANWYGGRWFGEFSLKQRNTIASHVDVSATVYPKIKAIAQIKRNGFKNDFHDLRPFVFFHLILTKPKAETLLKTGQYRLFYYSALERDFELIIRFWETIKVCTKHKYFVHDVSMYFDYLKLAENFNRDLKSPKYACPVDLKREHDKYVEKDRKRRFAQEYKTLKAEIRKDERAYAKEKKKFFDLEFKEENITIKVIKSVKEVMDLGDRFRHCIYSLKYHRKKYSLLFAVHVNDIPVETIEYDLKEFKVLQSRGKGNDATEYHDKILDIMAKHHKDIKEILKPKTKKK